MILPFILKLVLIALLPILLGWSLVRMARRAFVKPRVVLWLSLVSLLMWVGIVFLVFVSPQWNRVGRFLGKAVSPSRLWDFRLLWCSVLVLTAGAMWSLFRGVREYLLVQNLLRSAWLVSMPHLGGSAYFMEEVRGHLEDLYRDQIQNPLLRIGYTEAAQLPLTIGRTILAPVWTIFEDEGTWFGPLLDHEREHICLGHSRWVRLFAWLAILVPPFRFLHSAVRQAAEVEADRSVLAQARDEDEKAAYTKALSQIVETANKPIQGSFMQLGHDPTDVPLRQRQMQSQGQVDLAGFFTWSFLAITLVMLALGSGPVQWGFLKPLLSREIPRAFKPRILDPGCRISPLIGQGGDLQDGISVDATEALGDIPTTISVDLEGTHPIRSEIGPSFISEMNLEYRAVPRDSSVAPIPCAFELWTAQIGPLSPEGYEPWSTTDAQWFALTNTDAFKPFKVQWIDPQLSQKDDETFYPDYLLSFSVPKGWKLQIRNIHVDRYKHLALSRADKTQLEEAARASLQWHAPFKTVLRPMNLSWKQLDTLERKERR
jgi:hypothetical protein